MTLTDLRREIWTAANENTYTITICKQRIGWDYSRAGTQQDYERLYEAVKALKPPAEIEPPETEHDYKSRYYEAHKMNFEREFPAAWKDGHYCRSKFPRVETSNGLQTYIINFILWHGYRATRVNVMGRLIEQPEKQESGASLMTKKFIKSSTRKGSADVSSTIKGKSVMWEVKIKRDKPSADQLKEQARERKAGGEYYFVKTPNQFLDLWDGIMYGE